MGTNRGSIRREVTIDRPADQVWNLVGDPARVHEWFPSIVSCTVDGTERQTTTVGGVRFSETILTLDPIERRLQHEIHLPLLRMHLGTIDVVATGDQSCLVLYGTDADPATMALTIGGAAGEALEHLRTIFSGRN